MTTGEWALIHFLDAHLPYDRNWKKGDSLTNYKGWLIFAQPFLRGTRPDVIIFHSFIGIVIYEVKDWDLFHYNYDIRGTFFVHKGGKKFPKKSPIQ